MKIEDFDFVNRTMFLKQIFGTFHNLQVHNFQPNSNSYQLFKYPATLIKDATTCEQQHIQSFSNARKQSTISSEASTHEMLDQLPTSQAQFLCWNTIFHMPGKRSSCIAFALVVENARIYLNRKKPEKNKCTITVQIFQDKLCNACNCISKYYQICIKTEYKPSK